MKIGDPVRTQEFGSGVIVEVEEYSRIDGGTKRFGLRLEKNPFSYDVAFFWPHELQLETNTQPVEVNLAKFQSASQQ